MSSRGEEDVGDARIEFQLDGADDAIVLVPGGGLEQDGHEIQEISMPNDWSEEYLRLSTSFDAALEDCT